MPPIYKRLLFCCTAPLLIFLGGCGAKPECDSIETRTALLQKIADDHDNALVAFAEKNATNSGATKSGSIKPQYLLGQRMVIASPTSDRRTLKCSGGISVSVGDMKATKEIAFTVQKSSDGKISVSVDPFEF